MIKVFEKSIPKDLKLYCRLKEQFEKQTDRTLKILNCFRFPSFTIFAYEKFLILATFFTTCQSSKSMKRTSFRKTKRKMFSNTLNQWIVAGLCNLANDSIISWNCHCQLEKVQRSLMKTRFGLKFVNGFPNSNSSNKAMPDRPFIEFENVIYYCLKSRIFGHAF